MEMLETNHRARQAADDNEYRRLADQHREYERQLEHIANRRPFTQQDWFEESVVKKRKLLVRDKMASLTRDYTLANKAVAS